MKRGVTRSLNNKHQYYLKNLPSDWDKVPLEKLGTIYSGGTPSRLIPFLWDGSIAWVTPGELTKINSKWLTQTKEYITEAGLSNSAAKLMPKGTILVTTRATIGSVAVATIPICTNQGFKSIVPNEYTDSIFYYYLLRFIAPEIVRLSSGSTFDEISRRDFANIVVPRPPIKEQRRIAEILDTVDETIAQTEALIAKLKQIRAGLLQDLLTRGLDEDGKLRDAIAHPEQFKDSPLGQIPKDWEVCPIEEKLDKIIDYRGKTPKKSESGIPLITAKNIREGFLDREHQEYISEHSYTNWMTRGIPNVGDILFTTEAPLGNVAFFPNYKVALAQRIITLCPNLNELVPGYLLWLLLFSNSRRRLEQKSTGSTVLGIKQSVFRSLLFQFPPLKEQKIINKVIDTHNTRIRTEEAYLNKLKLQKQGLMHDLLTGKVRVNQI